jgi:hypothetical protein
VAGTAAYQVLEMLESGGEGEGEEMGRDTGEEEEGGERLGGGDVTKVEGGGLGRKEGVIVTGV